MSYGQSVACISCDHYETCNNPSNNPNCSDFEERRHYEENGAQKMANDIADIKDKLKLIETQLDLVIKLIDHKLP